MLHDDCSNDLCIKNCKSIEKKGLPLFPVKERNWVRGNNLYNLRNIKSNHWESHLLLLMWRLSLCSWSLAGVLVYLRYSQGAVTFCEAGLRSDITLEKWAGASLKAPFVQWSCILFRLYVYWGGLSCCWRCRNPIRLGDTFAHAPVIVQTGVSKEKLESAASRSK